MVPNSPQSIIPESAPDCKENSTAFFAAAYRVIPREKIAEKSFCLFSEKNRTKGRMPLVRNIYCIIYSTLQAWERVMGELGESFPSLPERTPWATMVWT